MNLEARIRKLKKYKEYEGRPLSAERIEKLLKILFAVPEDKKCKPKYGSFILASQNTKYAECLKPIVEFDFSGGKKQNYLGTNRDSANLAWNTINDASAHSRLNDDESAVTFLFPNTPIYMNLNASNGRFFAACYGDSMDFHMQAVVYLTIARVLAVFYPKDPILQESYRVTAEKQEYMKEMAALESFIDGLWETF